MRPNIEKIEKGKRWFCSRHLLMLLRTTLNINYACIPFGIKDVNFLPNTLMSFTNLILFNGWVAEVKGPI
jgi:hypothetical protein